MTIDIANNRFSFFHFFFQEFFQGMRAVGTTRAKSCDHEIVRVQKKVSKGGPKTPPKSCSVKSYVTRPSTKCHFNGCLFMRIINHDKIE